MDADSEYEIKRARDAIQMIETIQSMIDVSADRLEGLRTQCSTSAELTQQEIRTLEGKLVKHFSRQLVIKARFGEELQRELGDVPCLALWLRVVGLSQDAIDAICSRVATLEALRERAEHELRALLAGARDEEVRRLCRAMQRLRSYTEALARGEGAAELPLYWDSWERHARGSPRNRDERNHKKGGKSPTTPVSKRKQAAHLPAPAALTKSRSHESQLSVRPDASDLSDNSQSSVVAEGSPPASPREPEPDHTPQRVHHNNVHNQHLHYNAVQGSAPGGGAPRSPRTPTYGGRCMAHDIAHRFTKTFNMIATCDYCDKQMLFGSGLKCKECKFKCHRDCESKVPPSCGLPPEFVVAFKEKFHKDGGYYTGSVSSRAGFFSSLTPKRRARVPAAPHPAHAAHPYTGGPDSSSNTSSCNSSTPSSPALPPATPQPHHLAHHPPHVAHLPPAKQQFHFPVKTPVSSPNHTLVIQSPARVAPDGKDEMSSSMKSERSRRVSLSSAGGEGAGAPRADSLELGAHDSRWPRQNSLSMKEWDIPYDELKLFEVIGAGRFGTVYRGSWHGAVAVKLLHVHAHPDHCAPLDTFKHEVRHVPAGGETAGVRHRAPRQLARRRRGEAAARARAPGPLRAARHLQARGGDVPQDPPREPRAVHGRVHEAAAARDRHLALQGHDALHTHPPAQGQVHREQERHSRAADITGYGLPARAGYHPQGPEDEEHIPGERQGGHHGLWPLQCHQALFW
ncbi:kinase suppressor of Ras 2 isoform X2 [Epargyreus clarus]|uniref:kinase suppressor of Ras 2 isoform X2 n=1 Tax=Epargyreus clarus TaxID=520877 RepID=UPI003C2DB15C